MLSSVPFARRGRASRNGSYSLLCWRSPAKPCRRHGAEPGSRFVLAAAVNRGPGSALRLRRRLSGTRVMPGGRCSGRTGLSLRPGRPGGALRTRGAGRTGWSRLSGRTRRAIPAIPSGRSLWPRRSGGSGRPGSAHAAVRDHHLPRFGAGRQRPDAAGRDISEAELEPAAPVGGDAVALVQLHQEIGKAGAAGDDEPAAGDLRFADLDFRRRRQGPQGRQGPEDRQREDTERDTQTGTHRTALPRRKPCTGAAVILARDAPSPHPGATHGLRLCLTPRADDSTIRSG